MRVRFTLTWSEIFFLFADSPEGDYSQSFRRRQRCPEKWKKKHREGKSRKGANANQ